MGFRLFGAADLDPASPMAVEAALPIPGPGQDRS
jgi:hypothetical protein